jgi:hypothetical protein
MRNSKGPLEQHDTPAQAAPGSAADGSFGDAGLVGPPPWELKQARPWEFPRTGVMMDVGEWTIIREALEHELYRYDTKIDPARKQMCHALIARIVEAVGIREGAPYTDEEQREALRETRTPTASSDDVHFGIDYGKNGDSTVVTARRRRRVVGSLIVTGESREEMLKLALGGDPEQAESRWVPIGDAVRAGLKACLERIIELMPKIGPDYASEVIAGAQATEHAKNALALLELPPAAPTQPSTKNGAVIQLTPEQAQATNVNALRNTLVTLREMIPAIQVDGSKGIVATSLIDDALTWAGPGRRHPTLQYVAFGNTIYAKTAEEWRAFFSKAHDAKVEIANLKMRIASLGCDLREMEMQRDELQEAASGVLALRSRVSLLESDLRAVEQAKEDWRARALSTPTAIPPPLAPLSNESMATMHATASSILFANGWKWIWPDAMWRCGDGPNVEVFIARSEWLRLEQENREIAAKNLDLATKIEALEVQAHDRKTWAMEVLGDTAMWLRRHHGIKPGGLLMFEELCDDIRSALLEIETAQGCLKIAEDDNFLSSKRDAKRFRKLSSVASIHTSDDYSYNISVRFRRGRGGALPSTLAELADQVVLP